MSASKQSLFNLTSEYINLYNQLIESADDDGVVDKEISASLEAKDNEFTEKAIAVATVYRKFSNEVFEYDNEIKRLENCKKRLEKCRDKIKDNLLTACQRLGIDQIDGMYAKISFRTSEQTIIDDENFIPPEYFIQTVSLKPDKEKIKADIKSGKEIPGAHIEKKKNLQIK